MNFEFSEEELAIKSQARRYLAEHAPLSLCRELLDGKGTEKAAALWSGIAELGWPAVAIAEADGGLGMGHLTLCAIAEEVGRAAAPLPLLPSLYLAGEALSLYGSAAQRAHWLPELASGACIGTCVLAPGPNAPRVVAGRITGTASPAGAGGAAGLAILEAESEAGRGLYLVDLAGDGVARNALETIDDSRPHAALRLQGAPAEKLPGATPEAIATLRNRAAVLVAFEQLGGADACLEMARAFVLERRSFGRVVGSYQAVKHLLADIYVANELARSNAYYAAWALAENAPELPLAAAVARVSATEAYEFAARENIQLHGGIGFTWEADPHLHYRRSRLLALALGPLAYWQDQVVVALDQPQEPGNGF
jgi:alkylation response protein AidB-like acyl-CoA dehydrogenase